MSSRPPLAPCGVRILRSRTFLTVIIVTGSLIAGNRAQAQSRADPAPSSTIDVPAPDTAPAPAAAADPSAQPSGGLSSDIKQYFTAPLHWDARDWAWFGGALAAIAASHHFDSQVRTHFVGNLTPSQIQNLPSDDVQDILPTVGVLLATWGYASWTGSSAGHEEAWAMFEAAGLSTVTAYGLKYSLRRLGPDQTSDPDEWEKTGGKSFPSEHSTAAFAVGTVLAESGNDEYRWLRRLLGYGLGVAPQAQHPLAVGYRRGRRPRHFQRALRHESHLRVRCAKQLFAGSGRRRRDADVQPDAPVGTRSRPDKRPRAPLSR
jgi:membrane-associated phospholipid phosphatase